MILVYPPRNDAPGYYKHDTLSRARWLLDTRDGQVYALLRSVPSWLYGPSGWCVVHTGDYAESICLIKKRYSPSSFGIRKQPHDYNALISELNRLTKAVQRAMANGATRFDHIMEEKHK